MITGLRPNWHLPAGVGAFSTNRLGGVSQAPYASLNLGAHVGDDVQRVEQNRLALAQQLNLPSSPCWLQQVHGHKVVNIAKGSPSDKHVVIDGQTVPLMPNQAVAEADGAYTNAPNVVLAILTADCLPVLLASNDGNEIAALHCGWRSIAGNIIAHGVNQFKAPAKHIHAWLGPAIGPQQFAVGNDVYAAMVALNPALAAAFVKNTHAFVSGPYLANIYALARLLLEFAGVRHISAGEYCTFSQPEDYFSYRRDGETGRMASLIWRSE